MIAVWVATFVALVLVVAGAPRWAAIAGGIVVGLLTVGNVYLHDIAAACKAAQQPAEVEQ